MRRRAALAATLALGALAGCGGEEAKLSDAKIAGALHLEQKGSGYQVGSNPFCRIREILNDAGEVSGLTDAQRRVAITSRQGRIGVVVVTPFAPSCEKSVAADLTHLDRKSGS